MSVKILIMVDGREQEVELPDEIARGLAEIAARNGLTLAGALQQAVVNENFLERQQAAGAKLLIQKDESLRELLREPAGV